MRRIRKLLVCVMCVLMLCSLAGCGNNTGTANDNLNDATSGENHDGSGENGNNTGNNAGDQNGDSILDDAEPAVIRAKKIETVDDKAVYFLNSVFDAMGLAVDVEVKMNEEEKEMDVNLTGEEMGLLIGKRGQTLDSLQYLVSLVVNKESEDYLRVKLDTENYRERRKETLETLAKNIAYKVKRTRRPVSLEPMNPYERRIIHSALQNDKYVFTKSEGEEPFRHVVIALKKEERRERRPRYERRERTAGSENSYRSSSQE